MTAKNPKATYACINRGEALCPREIERQSICFDDDIAETLSQLLKSKSSVPQECVATTPVVFFKKGIGDTPQQAKNRQTAGRRNGGFLDFVYTKSLLAT